MIIETITKRIKAHNKVTIISNAGVKFLIQDGVELDEKQHYLNHTKEGKYGLTITASKGKKEIKIFVGKDLSISTKETTKGGILLNELLREAEASVSLDDCTQIETKKEDEIEK